MVRCLSVTTVFFFQIVNLHIALPSSSLIELFYFTPSNYDYNNQGIDPNLVRTRIHDVNDQPDDSLHETDDGRAARELCDARDGNADNSYANGVHVRDDNSDAQSAHARSQDILDKGPDGAKSVHELVEKMVRYLEMKQ
ncbi:hypothetical protein ACFFHM_19435 [Halalkalibacter kiskunsagensis]|uniref:Uncharacterized protein n=1 Tax=Halalkalibacter kiskunsagensis TaxID=1548599 RepID=A0ABV6KH05_9BACI